VIRLKIAQANERILLIAPDGKHYLLRLQAGRQFHTNKGILDHDRLIGAPFGRYVLSHLDQPFMLLRPSLHDKLMRLSRRSQIIYPKEIGQILLKLDVGHGNQIIEAGTGSGALAIALAHAVQPDGMVYSYEKRPDMLTRARRNLAEADLPDYVTFIEKDIAEGFDQVDVDALFLDVREPWEYLPQVCAALSDGGFFGALVPTTNQVSDLLAEMQRRPFIDVEVLEILLRHYKPVPARLRPHDHMVGHTGYLIFARKVRPLEETWAEPQAPGKAGSTDQGRDSASATHDSMGQNPTASCE
jgi:tRNA (adenine57-N1/adenine58-N1)-methyltransferase